MIRPAALLIPACLVSPCLIGAQAPGTPQEAPHAPVRAIALALALKGTASSLDLPGIQAELTGLLRTGGIAVVPTSEASNAQGAYRLDLSLEVTDFPEGSHLVAVQGALERLTDLDGLAKGEEFRWVGYSTSAHAAGEAFPLEARRLAFLVAASLISKAAAAHDLATSSAPSAAAPAAMPFPIPASPFPKAVEVPFSKERIKHQPPAPAYASAAKGVGIQGTVHVIVTVNPEGRPVRVLAESGPQELKAAALRYALQWRFEPVVRDGTPRWAWFRLPIPLKLGQPVPSAN
ncbi:energy transducer TonB [Geothrix terrae]|uniref:energy transducer TonB n=1 Tax=Geothrix terrae TaxID=2922720 RepID=UPI0023DEBFC3|nr:energy transducer TonB [Geothrix terrae]